MELRLEALDRSMANRAQFQARFEARSNDRKIWDPPRSDPRNLIPTKSMEGKVISKMENR
ncbi:hypothetical protein CR513_01487, partial [Mucuna pruriens]